MVDDVADEIRGDFIGFCLAPRFVDQAGQTLFAKSLQGSVEGFPRISELAADPGDEASLMAMSAQHLVFELAAILSLKEIGALEQMRLDGFFGMSHGIPIGCATMVHDNSDNVNNKLPPYENKQTTRG